MTLVYKAAKIGTNDGGFSLDPSQFIPLTVSSSAPDFAKVINFEEVIAGSGTSSFTGRIDIEDTYGFTNNGAQATITNFEDGFDKIDISAFTGINEYNFNVQVHINPAGCWYRNHHHRFIGCDYFGGS